MGVAMQMRVERVNPNEGRYANRNRIILLRRLRKRVRRYDGGGGWLNQKCRILPL